MEKVIYVLWRPDDTDAESFAAQLCGPVARSLVAAGAHGVEVDVDDAEVAASIMRIRDTDPPMAALVCLWLDTAATATRRPFDDLIATAADRFAAFLVTESVPLPNTLHPPQPGQRTTGVNNVAFLRRPAHLDHATWLHLWQDEHTAVALETQSSFGYVQNVVVRALTDGAPDWSAIVSELFPPEALTDVSAMFAATGDPELFRRNFEAMRASTGRFGADTNLDVLPTSQYVVSNSFGG